MTGLFAALTAFAVQTLRVRRVYDEKHNTLVYTAYATRFQNSVSALDSDPL